MATGFELNYCQLCGARLSPDDFDGICSECDGGIPFPVTSRALSLSKETDMTLAAIAGTSFVEHPSDPSIIYGHWQEDGSRYEIVVPHQLRDVILRVLQRAAAMPLAFDKFFGSVGYANERELAEEAFGAGVAFAANDPMSGTSGQRATSFAWVIEDRESELSRPRYFTGKRHPAMQWSDPGDHAAACRFARREDAERIAAFAGFYDPNPTHRICEHGWMD